MKGQDEGIVTRTQKGSSVLSKTPWKELWPWVKDKNDLRWPHREEVWEEIPQIFTHLLSEPLPGSHWAKLHCFCGSLMANGYWALEMWLCQTYTKFWNLSIKKNRKHHINNFTLIRNRKGNILDIYSMYILLNINLHY